MNEINLSNTQMPIVSSCDFLVAAEAFYHADRITDFHVLIYVTDGCIYVTEEQTDYAVRPGGLLFLKSGVRHFGKHRIERGTRWHYVHFYLDQQAEASRQRQIRLQGDGNRLSEGCPTPLFLTLPKTLTDLSCSRLEAQILSFTDCFHRSLPQKDWQTASKASYPADPDKVWHQNQLFLSLLTEIAGHSQAQQPAFSLGDQIAGYLTDHYAAPFSAALLEQHFFLSYKHMAAVFKKEKQMTMQQFHTRVRMNVACRLLRSTLLPVGEISLRVGYRDMLYFSRCFHSFVGMSPTEYRRQPPAY